MNNINEETPIKYIKSLNKLRNDPELSAIARLNIAKNDLIENGGGDFWEGGTKENFFKTMRDLINSYYKNDKNKLIFLTKMLDKYEKITPNQENIKSNEQRVIDKENSKPVKYFNSKTGNYKSVSTERFNY